MAYDCLAAVPRLKRPVVFVGNSQYADVDLQYASRFKAEFHPAIEQCESLGASPICCVLNIPCVTKTTPLAALVLCKLQALRCDKATVIMMGVDVCFI